MDKLLTEDQIDRLLKAWAEKQFKDKPQASTKRMKTSAKPYNGHPSWNAWNVSLWIGNDEGLYNFAIECLRKPTPKGKEPSINVAATRFLNLVSGKTPDGARYSRTSVRHALAGLRD